jgi:general secretion pathway protein D
MKKRELRAGLNDGTDRKHGDPALIHLRRTLRTAGVAAACLAIVSCSGGGLQNNYDAAGGASKKDYESLLGRRTAEKEKPAEPPIPDFQSVLAAPSAPELADTRRVSIAVTETVPVRDILIELARKANVDLEMDPRITGGVIMTATDRPFIDVVARLCDLADLRYKFVNNVLSVSVDDPYMEQYHLDVLNLSRSSSSEVSSSTDASSASQSIGASGGGGGGNNKSEASVSAKSTADFWTSISTNIKNIIDGIQSRRTQTSEMKAEFVPQAAQGAAPAAGAAPAGLPMPAAAAGPLAAARGLSQRQDQVSAILAQDPGTQAANAQIAAQAGAAQKAASGSPLGNSNFSVNAEAGIVTVFATQRQHKAIDRYLRDVLSSINQQVLIEAKVLEIQLDDQYRAGINWSALLGPCDSRTPGFSNAAACNGGAKITTDFSRNVTTTDFSDPTIKIVGSNAANTLNYAAQLVKGFGTVRTLSNPRLTVTNNQMAMLKVASNQVFFTLTATTTDSTATTAGKTTVNSQIKTVPVGIIMSVQPAIDPVTRRISLSLRPSITRITSFIQDPGVQITIAQFNANNPSIAQNISSLIPVIETREMDSIINMDSGETMVMGGLMQDSSQNNREGIPGAMDIPVLGQAVSVNIKQNKVSELVIFIRATLVSPRNTISDEDIRLYKTFTPDPRPIAF